MSIHPGLIAGACIAAFTASVCNSVPQKPLPTAGPAAAFPTLREPTAAQQNRRTNVTNLYNDTCAKCHGLNGEGGGGGTPSLLTIDKFDQKWDKPFFEATRNGVPNMGMEGYGETLSDEEIWGLVVHIRELQSKALRNQTAIKKQGEVYQARDHRFKVETVIGESQGLKVPWGIDWLSSSEMLVTNRPGFLSYIKDGKVIGNVEGIPASVEIGQGGLMDVAVHPTNGYVYLAFTDPAKNGQGGQTKIVRGKVQRTSRGAIWTNSQTMFETPQEFYTGSGVHFGSRILFDNKGYMFFVIGERGENMPAQDIKRPAGKIYRLHDDGRVPKDNPFIAEGGPVAPAVWSYGHRNPQALALTPDGRLWDTEHAPRGGDELNEIKRGANYGWPVISHGINYNDSPFQVPWPRPGQKMELPVYRWLPSIGTCGMDTVRGSAFTNWSGDLVAGGLSGACVDRIRVKDGKLVEVENIFLWQGRVREVAVGKDGLIYIATNGPDRIVRLIPVK